MTLRTDFRLGGFGQVFGIFLMNTMAIGAGKRSGFMLTGGPHGHFAFAVTLQANGVLFFLGFGRFRAQVKNTAAFAFFGVVAPGP